MRILLLIDHLGCGGAQTQLVELICNWPAVADELHVLALGRRADWAPRLEASGRARVEVLGYHRWDARVVAEVARRLRATPFDVAHARLRKSVLSLLLARAPRPTRRVIHLNGDPAADPWNRWLLRWVPRQEATVVAVSRHTARSALRLGLVEYRHRPRVILNGLNGRRVLEEAAECAVTRSDLGLRNDSFLLGYVGRLDAGKGLQYLLPAVRALAPRVHLLLVGDGPLRGWLEREVRRAGLGERVRFAGFQPRTAGWLNLCDAFVLPSLSEGLPMTILEAFALRVPVIATRVGGVEELVRHEVTGLLTPPRDTPALQHAIVRLAGDPSLGEQLVHHAHRTLTQSFTIARAAHRTRALYQSLLASQPLPVHVA